jgi:hypothetical protein
MGISMWRQSASFLGAMLILVAYAGYQMGWMNPRRAGYHILNAIGSAILGYIAFHPFQVGFVLEVTWTLISIYAFFAHGLNPEVRRASNFNPPTPCSCTIAPCRR